MIDSCSLSFKQRQCFIKINIDVEELTFVGYLKWSSVEVLCQSLEYLTKQSFSVVLFLAVLVSGSKTTTIQWHVSKLSMFQEEGLENTNKYD